LDEHVTCLGFSEARGKHSVLEVTATCPKLRAISGIQSDSPNPARLNWSQRFVGQMAAKQNPKVKNKGKFVDKEDVGICDCKAPQR
jgi:hypothetical protein